MGQADPFIARGLENYGLTILSKETVEDEETRGNTLIHEVPHHRSHPHPSGCACRERHAGGHPLQIIHSWVGNLYTVDSWQLIPVQEGLVTYLDWLVSDLLGVVSLQDKFPRL